MAMTQEPEQRPIPDAEVLATEVLEESGTNEPQSVWKPALKEAAHAFALAAVLISVTYALAFKQIHPEFARFMERDAAPVTANGRDFIPVSIGKGKKHGSDYIIENFSDDEAVLYLPREFVAEDYPFIKVNLSGFTRYSKAKIIWRQADRPETHALEFNRRGDEVTQIAMVYGGEAYAGRIDAVALLFYDGPALGFDNNDDVDITIKRIEFRPFSAFSVIEQIFEDWTNPPLWQGYSNNIVRGIHPNGMVFPNVVANLLVITGLAVAALMRWQRRIRLAVIPEHRLLTTALCLCLYGWVFTDVLRWHWRAEQLIDTHGRYAGLPLEERIRNNDIRCARFPEGCAAYLLPYF
jgi:hypothetical protein